ncbi:hypothetical protein IX51_04910 [uncultured archaeon]|nr:hypothetical protein IX51_04910 [uncultured archaeon]HKJ97206.1 AAA family ATPase [Thermoplasmataceae archaeon]
MIIDYIQLNNFLSHSDTLIRFENGINIIYGKNGAGKSSIVDAIRFALFGEKRGDKIAELIRSGARECAVTIGFRLNDRYYELFRSLTLGKSSITGRNSWIKLDNVMIAETAEGVNKEIKDGLRIPKDIFLNSVFVRQGEMDALISETPANREKLFSKIIGIDVLSENAQKIKSIRDALRLEEARFSNIQDRLDRISGDRSEAKEELEKAEVLLSEEAGREKKAHEAMQELEIRRDDAMQKKAGFDAVRTRIDELKAKAEAVKNNIGKSQQLIKGISFSAAEKERIEKETLFARKSEVTRFFNLKSEFRTLEVSLENVRTAISDYEAEKKKLGALAESHRRYREVESLVKDLEEKAKSLHSYKALKDSADEEVKAEKRKAMELSGTLSSPEFADLMSLDRNSVARSIGELEKGLREIEGQRNALKERVGGINRQLTELRKNKETLGDNRKCPVCGSDLDDFHLGEIHSAYQAREEEFLKEIAESGAEVSGLNNAYRKREEELARLRRPGIERFMLARDELSRLKDSIAEKEERMDELKSKFAELSHVEGKLGEAMKEKEALKQQENEFNSITYAVSRIPIETLREKLARYENEEREKSELLESLVISIGMEPSDEDRNRLEALVEKYERIRNAEAEYNRVLNELENDRRALAEIDSDLEKKSNEIISLGDVRQELERAVELYNRQKKELDGIRQNVTAYSERMKTFRSTIEKLELELSSLEKDKLKLDKIKAASAKLEKLRSAFERNGIQALIRKDSSVSINNMTRNYLSSFNFEFDDVRIDENFDIKVINNGVEEPLDSLSGGERISLAIAVRLAIAKYLTGRVSTVIMDEPTNFLDEDRRNNLKEIIQYSLKDENMVQQMIMITHHTELTSAADASFEVTKVNGVSSVYQG